MRSPSIHILFFFLLLFKVPAFAEISEQRKFQLDSIASTMPKTTCRNLDDAHRFMHQIGQNDEERVWLFFGYMAIHFKYDKKRKGDKKAPVFSPEYTAQRLSGVCRDYSKVFLVLCQKSQIPCMEVPGQSPVFFFVKVYNFVRLISNRYNHVWNIVRINGEWKLMDPTWGKIQETQRFSKYDPKTKSTKTIQVKIVNRQYYMADPDFMQLTHTPMHPAFMLKESVATFKSARKNKKRQDIFEAHYPFQTELDSIFMNPHPMFCKRYVKECRRYSGSDDLYLEYAYELSLPTRKEARYKKPTLEEYDATLKKAKELKEYILKENGVDFAYPLYEFEKVFWNKREKLAKKLAEEQRNKKRK